MIGRAGKAKAKAKQKAEGERRSVRGPIKIIQCRRIRRECASVVVANRDKKRVKCLSRFVYSFFCSSALLVVRSLQPIVSPGRKQTEMITSAQVVEDLRV